MKRSILLVLFSTTLLAGNIQVVDQQSGHPLPGVNITIVGTSEGLNTDLEGYFFLADDFREHDLKFSYMGYQDTTLSYAELRKLSVLGLMPRVLDMGEIEVISSKLEWEQTDLPSIVTILRTRDLVDQGNVEIKEVLQRDPSVVVDESPTGVHEISIRGSNAREVLIIFDGIPLNSSYGGGFDLSWLDLNDIEAISIIKGSGTLRYGSGAFGGVVVIEPLKSGTSGLSISGQQTDCGLNSFSFSDIMQKGPLKTRLTYSSREQLPFGYYNDQIISQREFINFHAHYALQDTTNAVSLNYVHISEAVEPNALYANQYSDQYSQLKYSGRLGPVPGMLLQLLYRSNGNDESNLYDQASPFSNSADEQTVFSVLENKWVSRSLVNFFRLEYKEDGYDSRFESENVQWSHIDIHKIQLDQTWLAATEILKYRTALEVPFVDFMELNASYRYDLIDLAKAHQAERDGDQYFESSTSTSTRQVSRRNGFTLNKTRKDLKYQFFYSSGTSLRYPTMQDLYQREITTIVAYKDTTLNPELNASSEVGTQISFRPGNAYSLIDGVDIQASVFRNRYLDKIYYRQIPRALPTPINFQGTTELSGFEASVMTATLDDHLRIYAGTSRLNISSYSMFPNKPEFKDVVELEVVGMQANLRLQYFHEGQQAYATTSDNLNFSIVDLPGRENLNLYASARLPLGQTQLVLGFSALNLRSAESESNYLNQRKWVINLGLSF